jgi:hypothetical protein
MKISFLANFVMTVVVSHLSAVKSDTQSRTLMSGLKVNTNSRNTHNMKLRIESDSEDSCFRNQLDKEVQRRQKGSSPFSNQYPAPHAKDSKWRFDLHFAVDVEVVRPLVSCKENEHSFGYRRNRSLDQKIREGRTIDHSDESSASAP